MSLTINPVGDRLLVKLVKLTEKKVGDTVLTLAQDTRKRYQPECSKAVVIAGGGDVPEGISEGCMVLIRTDAGVGLTQDVIQAGDARLYRVVDYPEVLAILKEDSLIGGVGDLQKMEVVA